MSKEHPHHTSSAGLTINTQTGEVISDAAKLRLSPVNTRVLKVLLQQAPNTVSRQLLFDDVWPNQEVSDDALTRCISDLRAQLKSLTTTTPLIETIPKVGYRWQPTINSKNTQVEKTDHKKPAFWSQNLKPVLMAVTIFLLLLWGLLGWLYTWSKPNATSVVVLPTDHNSPNPSTYSDVATCIKQAILSQDDMQYLSTIALDAHSGNPFPYYHHEYGVRWIVASQLKTTNEKQSITFNLVDAKTALVTYSEQHAFESSDELKFLCLSFVAFVATL